MKEFYKLVFKVTVVIFVIAISLASCTKKMREDLCFALNAFGLLYTPERNLELNFEKQVIGTPFSIANYCEEKYDSILLLSPYVNTEIEDFVNLKMSDNLRITCENNTMFDTFSTLLFISNGKVEAFSEVIRIDADFVKIANDYPQFFSFEQKFILDKDRNVHLYSE
jgi:hypothetical protein